jgi:hypothetical protein
VNDGALENPELYTLERIANDYDIRMTYIRHNAGDGSDPSNEYVTSRQYGERFSRWDEGSPIYGPEENSFAFLHRADVENTVIIESLGLPLIDGAILKYVDLTAFYTLEDIELSPDYSRRQINELAQYYQQLMAANKP